MGVRLIAIDIDGTLLDSRWDVPEANREAIVRAVERHGYSQKEVAVSRPPVR